MSFATVSVVRSTRVENSCVKGVIFILGSCLVDMVVLVVLAVVRGALVVVVVVVVVLVMSLGRVVGLTGG